MFQKLVNHNKDLELLVKKGYSISIKDAYLIVNDIPYLDAELNIKWGTIVSTIVFQDELSVSQQNHQVYFVGTMPHGLNKKPIPNLGAQIHQTELCPNLRSEFMLSNKPQHKGSFREYKDFFEKIENYVNLISGPAMASQDVNPFKYNCDTLESEDSIYKFQDTFTSLAGINGLSNAFREDVIAVIGLGGTGAYLLDFMAKTPVKEIRIFDNDMFYIHNAYRSPGHVDKTEFLKPKTEVYYNRYENFRKGIIRDKLFIDETSSEKLQGVTFAFVCVDKGSSRSTIFDLLFAMNIPFIDVGMGLNRKNNAINGLIRTTYFPLQKNVDLRKKKLAPENNDNNDEYRMNIQISELNALNACLAIIRFKQIRGFYYEQENNIHFLFGVGDLRNTGDDFEN